MHKLKLYSCFIVGVLLGGSLPLQSAGRSAKVPSPQVSNVMTLLDQGQSGQAEQAARDLVLDSTTSTQTLLELGHLLLGHRMTAAARDAFARASQENPRSDDAALGLGQAYLGESNFDQARSCFERALRLNPASSRARFFLGVTLTRLGQEQLGLQQVRSAAQMDPQNVEIQKFLAIADYQAKRYAEAAKVLERLLVANPDSDLCLLQVESYHQALNYPKALEAASACARKFPRSARLAFSTGVQLESLGRFAESEPWFEKSAALDPSMAEADEALGESEAQMGHFDQAIGAFRKALDLRPDYFEAMISLATAYQNRGDTSEAKEVLQRAAQASPNNPRCHLMLSRLYFAEKQYRESAAERQTFLTLSQAAGNGGDSGKTSIQD
jgi:tetratricopeptide (TPR) repeat protein